MSLSKSFVSIMFLLTALSAHSTPPPQSGIGVVWGGANEDKILQFPYVHYGQGYDQWKAVEPVEGQYDWSRIDAKLKHYSELGKRVPMQINSPCPEWIFQYVASTGTARGGKSPQYWDPIYLEKLERFLKAYADHLGTSPYKETVLYVRMQYLAIHTESVFFDKKYIQGTASPDRAKWTFPANGHKYEVDLSPKLEGEMIQKITEMYLTHFGKYQIPVGLRLPGEKMLNDRGFDGAAIFDKWCSTPYGWILTTHYGMSTLGTDEARQWRRRCRENGTIGFMEAFGPFAPPVPGHFEEDDLHAKMLRITVPDAEAGKTKMVDLAPERAFYWQMLMNLDWGGSYVSVYGQDLLWADQQPVCRLAMDFVNKYAGLQNDPANAPGAWLALGDFLPRRADAKAEKNWGWFIREEEPSTSEALYLIGPEDQPYGAWARRIKDQATFTLDPLFAQSIAGKETYLHLIWLNEPGAKLEVKTGPNSLQTLESDDSSRWSDAWITVPAGSFGGEAAKVTLLAGEGQPVVHLIEIARE